MTIIDELIASEPSIADGIDLAADKAARFAAFIAEFTGYERTEDNNSVLQWLIDAIAQVKFEANGTIDAKTLRTFLVWSYGVYLDAIAAALGLTRLPNESDYELKQRAYRSHFSSAAAGSKLKIEFDAYSASRDVKDVFVRARTNRIDQNIYILSNGDPPSGSLPGVPDAALRSNVLSVAASDGNIADGTHYFVEPPTIQRFSISATAHYFAQYNPVDIEAAQRKNIYAYIDSVHNFDTPVRVSQIYKALQVDGVDYVTISSPASDLDAGDTTAYYCAKDDTDVALTLVVTT